MTITIEHHRKVKNVIEFLYLILPEDTDYF